MGQNLYFHQYFHPIMKGSCFIVELHGGYLTFLRDYNYVLLLQLKPF